MPCNVGYRWASNTVSRRTIFSLCWWTRNVPRVAPALKYLRKLQQTPVLIIDDFLMAAVPVDDMTNLLEIIEERHQLGSLIVTTQYPIANWHRLIPDPTLADAICDRLAHTSVHIRLQGESMRKRTATAETPVTD